MKKESKHAAKLRELGCVPYDETLSPKDMKEADALADVMLKGAGIPGSVKYNRKELRTLVAKGLLPHYFPFGEEIYIVDETGRDWHGPVFLDLEKELGFKKHTAALEAATLGRRNKMN